MKDNPNTEKFIDLWKKHYKHLLGECKDCGGFTVFVCEKALRQMLNAQLNRMDKEILKAKGDIL